MRHGNRTVPPVSVFAVFQCVQHFRNQIIYVYKLQLCIAIVHGYGQIVCGIVAEGCRYAVVVWSAPFAEQVRKAVDKHLNAHFLGIFEKKLLSRFFASAVVVVIPTYQGRLNRA